MWLLIVNQLLRKLKSKGVKQNVMRTMFSLQLGATLKFPQTFGNLIETVLKIVSTRTNGLEINSAKTKLVLIHNEI